MFVIAKVDKYEILSVELTLSGFPQNK